MNTPRPYLLSETNWKTVKETAYDVAVLPWGATEAHNYHLPYGTDVYQCDYVAREAGRQAWEQGARIIVLPSIPFGVNTGQSDIKLDINMNPSTQMFVLKDIVHSLHLQGIHKLVVLNGHGGNDFKQMLRELHALYPSVFLCTVNWFSISNRNLFFEEPGEHADEMETSAMLFIAPHLVLTMNEAGDGKLNPFRIKALQERWVWTERKWSKATVDTGVGNPHKATAEKGELFLKDCISKLASFLKELAHIDPDELYLQPDGEFN